MNLTQMPSDPFDVDHYRHNLVVKGMSDLLLKTYEVGAYPQLPNMSTETLWENLAVDTAPPLFRIRRLQQVAKRLPESGKILDIGPGWGEIIPLVIANTEREYTGLDFSSAMLQQLGKKYPQINLIHGDISQVTEKYDAIMALEVCEHILAHEIIDFYKNILSRLNDAGIAIISVPVYEDLKNMTLRCPNCGDWHNRMGHVRCYTPELLLAELRAAGFFIIATELIYAHFSSSVIGYIKRKTADLGRKAIGMGISKPLNIIVVASKKAADF